MRYTLNVDSFNTLSNRDNSPQTAVKKDTGAIPYFTESTKFSKRPALSKTTWLVHSSRWRVALLLHLSYSLGPHTLRFESPCCALSTRCLVYRAFLHLHRLKVDFCTSYRIHNFLHAASVSRLRLVLFSYCSNDSLVTWLAVSYKVHHAGPPHIYAHSHTKPFK
jgi:hypothetical protein